MYRLNLQQQAIAEKARAITEHVIAPRAALVDTRGEFPQESLDALAREGFWGLTIAPEYGGMGQGLRVMCAVLDQIAQGCASTAMVYLMHLCGVTAYAAATEKTSQYLRAAAQGQHLSTLAWSEFGSRSHFWAPVSQEQTSNGRTTITASKSFVTSAGRAQGYVVTTRWANAARPVDSTLYLVLGNDPGIRVSGPWDGLGMRGNMSAPMQLQDVALGQERALTEPGKGLDTMLSAVLPAFNLGNAAVCLGIAESAVQATQRHITTGRFRYNDSALADLPLERSRLAQMRIETDRARAHLASALDAVENPGPTTMLMVLESKAAAGESAVQVTDLGLRACGGAGFSRNLGVERAFRDARAAQIMGPTTDVLHEFIGRALCGMEVF
ncbi:MAG: acyl-CoA/acyl-ACP dehydrogenase [Chloroflexi bacterium]|nr:acyl-CoA/acyl-ACP dehydrogenase [Chloroflexota bacterium]